ncbi:MAG: SpoIIE family protein phosphatase [Treponema sp.]|jgi:sigma-B regulation protein RsbU (phosphoserine phosphatase)|nr:SpoIIE family protein phosphatase [Treponema sp.]
MKINFFMKQKNTLRRKISSLTFSISLVSVITLGIISLIGLWILRVNNLKADIQLRDITINETRNALEEVTTETLFKLVKTKVALIDEKFTAMQNSVEILTYYAEEIIKHPMRYTPSSVPPPNARNKGVKTAQFLRAQNVSLPGIVRESSLMGNMQFIMMNLVNLSDEIITTIYIGSELGYFIIVDEDSDKKGIYFDPRERPWYKQAKEKNSLIWTDVFPDNYGRGLEITCAKPFYDNAGNIAGVAGIGSLLTDLADIVKDAVIGKTGFAFLLDENGSVVASSGLPKLGNENALHEALMYNRSYEEITQRFLWDSIDEEKIEIINVRNKEYFISYTALKTVPWILAAVIGVEEVSTSVMETMSRLTEMRRKSDARAQKIVLFFILIYLSVIFAMVLFINYATQKFSNTLSKPILLLKEGVQQIANGNLDNTINIQTGDEIEDLGESVNKMASDLNKYINNLQNVTREKERIGAELSVAAKIQINMLPCIFPPFPNRREFDVFALMRSAKEVGGDFYDFFLIDENTLAIVMADVSEKGVPAALFMVTSKTLIKNTAQSGKSPNEVFKIVNNMLCENNDAFMFVTAFMAYLDIPSGKLTFVNAGHNPPLVKRCNGAYEMLSLKPGFILAGMPNINYINQEIILQKGDEIFLYTDGITETANNDRKFFGEQKLIKTVNEYPNLSLIDFCGSVMTRIEEFADGAEQADDITMLALRYKGENDAPARELLLEADTENLQRVFNCLEDVFSKTTVSTKLRQNVKLAVEEIFINIVNYAYRPGKGNVAIRFWIKDDSLIIEIEDCGVPYNPLQKEDPDITLGSDQRQIGGLGIFMVKKLMDQVEYKYENGKNILTLKKIIQS